MEKLLNTIKGLLTIPPVFFDGFLYVGIALFGFLSTQFGTDEAYQFVAPEVLFWLKTTVGSCSASLLALKLYRSTSYATHLSEIASKP